MKTIKGPAIFLGQFAGDAAPFNSWDAITKWAADAGYLGVQVPTWAGQLIDLKKAAESKTYCDELAGVARQNGVEITELSTHLQGQLVAVHPAYDEAFDGFAAPEVRGNPKARQEWAVQQVKYALKASNNLGINAHATFSGALAWPYFYPWPQRPAGLVETAFDELARRWKPILDYADSQGVDVAYEIHPGEDLHDGVTFEMFLERVGGHTRANMLYDPSHYVLQCLDYLDHIDIYKDRIKMFHVKDAEFNPTGRQGVYGGYQSWVNRAGRFRSLGDAVDSARSSRRWPPRLRRLGRGRMGMRTQAPGRRCPRRRRVRQAPHHPGHGPRLRRLRRRRHRRCRQPAHARALRGGVRLSP
jgi:sugar phosphate isomerase/epimerase